MIEMSAVCKIPFMIAYYAITLPNHLWRGWTNILTLLKEIELQRTAIPYLQNSSTYEKRLNFS